MKNLYESIFGKPADIVNQAKDALWNGFDNAIEEYKMNPNNKIFTWIPDPGANNIISSIYGLSKYMIFNIRKKISNSPVMAIWIDVPGESMKIFREIKIRGLKSSNIKDYTLLILQAFRNHPELLNDSHWKTQYTNNPNYTFMNWSEFKKRFLDK